MKLLFLIKEGLVGFRRARLAATITIITITLSLCLLGIFGLTIKNLSENFQRIYNRIHLEVFFNPALNETQLENLRQKIRRLTSVQEVNYISPEAALEAFKKDFGEDISTVLESNPLPPSFRVVLRTDYRQLSILETTVRQIKAFEEVDDVVYQANIVQLINRYFLLGMIMALAIGVVIFFISTMLIYNTIRLTIHSRHTIIEIMRLVGATNLFIKGPFIVEGILQGLTGSVLASGLLWIAADVIKTAFFPNLIVPMQYFGFLIVTGMLLGMLGSYLSVGKYLYY